MATKKVKRFAAGGMDQTYPGLVELPNAADPKYQDPAFIAAGQANADRLNSMLANARASGRSPNFSDFGVSVPTVAQPRGGEDINSLYQELLGRAPDPTGIAANRGASAKTIRQSIMESPEYANRMAGIEQPRAVLLKKGGRFKSSSSSKKVSKTASRRGDGIAQRGKTKGRMV